MCINTYYSKPRQAMATCQYKMCSLLVVRYVQTFVPTNLIARVCPVDPRWHPHGVCGGGSGRPEDAEVLPVRGHRQHGKSDGEQRPAREHPLQRNDLQVSTTVSTTIQHDICLLTTCLPGLEQPSTVDSRSGKHPRLHK